MTGAKHAKDGFVQKPRGRLYSKYRDKITSPLIHRCGFGNRNLSDMSEPSRMDEAPAPADPNKDWGILKIENKGRVCVCRIRNSRPPADFWTRVAIRWSYSDSDNNGFPGPSLRQKMDNFEDAIEALTDECDFSSLALVLTGLGLKEWSFYTRDYNQFIQKFNELMAGEPVVPIKIVYYQDPDCQYWGSYHKHVPED
jgi:hypothetical protein